MTAENSADAMPSGSAQGWNHLSGLLTLAAIDDRQPTRIALQTKTSRVPEPFVLIVNPNRLVEGRASEHTISRAQT